MQVQWDGLELCWDAAFPILKECFLAVLALCYHYTVGVCMTLGCF